MENNNTTFPFKELTESILCVPGSKIITSGSNSTHFTERPIMFINAGGGVVGGCGGGRGGVEIDIDSDGYFRGGDVLRTIEFIVNGGELSSVYQTARFGNFCYGFKELPAGEYLVDLYFAEIVNINGPKGMRVFDVFIQEEKVLCELDIYSIVGANKPLQVVGIRVSVGKDGKLVLRFGGVVGSPIVSGICVRRAADDSPSLLVKLEGLICSNCTAEIKIPSNQSQAWRMGSIAKYEKQIQELKSQCQRKGDECYEAWMSLTSANQQLEKVRMELDNASFHNLYLDQAMKTQASELRDVSSQHESDKQLWATAVENLERKVKIMKDRQFQLSSEAHECASSFLDLNKLMSAVQVILAQYDELKLRLNEEHAKRKELHNQLQEAKGNIRVFCRCRPFSKEEELAGYQTVVDFNAAKEGDLGIITSGSTKKTYRFDRVYTPMDDQVEVFADASPLVMSVLDGYNACIFAYGQTGTGKTFTMEGVQHNRGVNYRTLEQLFKTVEERKETATYDISVSVLEVYNEQIRDLLATTPTAKRLEVKQMSEGVHNVPGIVEAKVGNIEEAWDVLQAGSNARAFGSNNVNEHSSRSHCMLCTLVRSKNLISGECTMSKLWLVDLAGSERLAKTNVLGERLKEAQNINRSLSALGDVISALATKSSHVPYRNSKLTHLLQDSLGGNSKMLMFVQISPSVCDLGETLSSLNFATRVRGVELGPAKKQGDIGEVQKLKLMLDKAKQELRYKDDDKQKLEENIRNLESKAKQGGQHCKNQQDKISELEFLLGSKIDLSRQLEKQLLQLSEEMKGKEEICHNFQQKVKKLEDKLNEYKQADITNLQVKVKELENKMKERTKEFEFHSRFRQQPVKEPENKLLTRERDNAETWFLQQKINFLEEKLREYELGEGMSKPFSAERLVSTPPVGILASRVENNMRGTDSLNEKSLKKSTNRTIKEERSILLKGPDSLREMRRKRDIQCKGSENNFLLPTSLLEKNSKLVESDKTRQLDPSRALARITRNTKPSGSGRKTWTNNAPPKCHKDQVPEIRDISNKHKAWLR